MIPQYEHTQKGDVWFYLCILFLVVLIVSTAIMIALVLNGKDLFQGSRIGPVITWPACGVALLMVGWAAIVLSKLTVRIGNNDITIRFGPGVFQKKFNVEDVVGSRPVRNYWWYGWGIRYYLNGWLYNVAGLDAVELTFKNGKKTRIGTDEPEKLAKAIREAMGQMAKTAV